MGGKSIKHIKGKFFKQGDFFIVSRQGKLLKTQKGKMGKKTC